MRDHDLIIHERQLKRRRRIRNILLIATAIAIGAVAFGLMSAPAHAATNLTPEEQRHIANIEAQIAYAEATYEKQMANLQAQIDYIKNTAAQRERTRISHCTIPLLEIGCPIRDEWAAFPEVQQPRTMSGTEFDRKYNPFR